MVIKIQNDEDLFFSHHILFIMLLRIELTNPMLKATHILALIIYNLQDAWAFFFLQCCLSFVHIISLHIGARTMLFIILVVHIFDLNLCLVMCNFWNILSLLSVLFPVEKLFEPITHQIRDFFFASCFFAYWCYNVVQII